MTPSNYERVASALFSSNMMTIDGTRIRSTNLNKGVFTLDTGGSKFVFDVTTPLTIVDNSVSFISILDGVEVTILFFDVKPHVV